MVGELKVVIDDYYASAGDTISVAIQALNAYENFDLNAFQITIRFTPSLLTYLSTETEECLTEAWTVNSNGDIMGEVAINGFSVDNLNGSGDLFQLKFIVNEAGTDMQNTALTINNFQYNNGSPEPTIVSGLFTLRNVYDITGWTNYYSNNEAVSDVEITAEGYSSGDTITNSLGEFVFSDYYYGNYSLTANFVGEVSELLISPLDASMVARYALGLINLDGNQMLAGNVDADGDVDIYDAAIIARYCVGLVEELPAGIMVFTPETHEFLLSPAFTPRTFIGVAISDVSGNWNSSRNEWFTDGVTYDIEEDAEYLYVNINYNDEFFSLASKINYEISELEYIDYTSQVSQNSLTTFANAENGSLRLASYSIAPVSGSQIMTLKFRKLGQVDDESLEVLSIIFDENNSTITPTTYDAIQVNSKIYQNYPNPFNPSTNISFYNNKQQNIKIDIYNLKGQKVKSLFNNSLGQGIHNITWNAENVSSGNYFAKIKMADGYNDTIKGVYDIEISFWYNLLRPSGVTPIFQYSLNGFTYNNIESFTQSASGVYSISLPEISNSPNVRFRWQYLSSTVASNYLNIDDLEISGVLGNYLPPAPVQDFQIASVSPQELAFSWSAIENNFFNQYEISVMSQASLTNQLFVWNGDNDGELYSQETTTTTISGLIPNEAYYFAIRSTDISGNVSEWSEIISATPTSLPVISFLTENNTWFASQEPVIHLLVEDDVMVDASSLEYRIDANKNGIYDEDEVWIPIENYLNSNEIEVDLTLNLESDGHEYSLEVRCYDTQNSIYSYSGSNAQPGIDDDLNFNIDTLKPLVIEDVVTSEITDNSLTLEWLPYNDEDFSHYEIYYSTSYDLSLESNLFSTESDINLNNRLTSSTTITDLVTNQRYWFAVLAVDFAGNKGYLSNIVTNVLASDFLIIYDAYPLQNETQAYATSRQIQLGCKLKDAYGIDSSSIQYRYDADGNGQYDSNEEWLSAFSTERSKGFRSTSGIMNENGDFVLEVDVDVAYLTDGEELKFEFRAKDVNGYGYAYSGFEHSEGIADDWSVSIDSIFPTEISNILVGLITSTTAEIAWTSSQDANFLGYKIFYDQEPGVTSEDDYVSWLDYPELTNPGTGENIFTLSNLSPNFQYYLKVAAVDIAGNITFSDEISFFTVTDSKPKKPENITITFAGSDLILSWDNVTEDTNGNPIEDVIYDIYLSETPEFELDGSNYYDTAYENQYIFYGMGDVIQKIFFRVQAFSD